MTHPKGMDREPPQDPPDSSDASLIPTMAIALLMWMLGPGEGQYIGMTLTTSE